MDITPVTDRITMLRFPVGQAYALALPDGGRALVDAGLPGYADEILGALGALGGELRDIVLTHAHVDHTGSAADLVAATGARVLAGAADAAVVRGDAPGPAAVLQDWEVPVFEAVQASHPIPHAAPPCPVDVELVDGDTLDWGEEVRVVHVPGHTPGSIALHLPSSGVLFTGDTIANVQQLMPGVFNVDHEQMLASFRRQAALGVETACFGHGDPIVGGAGAALQEVARRLS